MCMDMRQGKWHAVSGKCIACIACELDIRKTWVELHGAFDSGCARFGVQQWFIQVEEVRGARCDRKQALFYAVLGILTALALGVCHTEQSENAVDQSH